MTDYARIQVADRTHTLVVLALDTRAHLGAVMGAVNAADRTNALRQLANGLLELALDDDPHIARSGHRLLDLLAAGVGANALQEARRG